MPRIPRNPGAGKRPVNTPARGPRDYKGGAGQGPARGERPQFTPDRQPSAEAKAAGRDVAAEVRAAIAARRHELLNVQFARALAQDHPHGHQAAKDLLDRIVPVKQDITTDGERVGYVIAAPPEAESAEAWIRQHKPQ